MKLQHIATALIAAAVVTLPSQAIAGTKASKGSERRVEVSKGRFPPGLKDKCENGNKGNENACERNAWKSRGCS